MTLKNAILDAVAHGIKCGCVVYVVTDGEGFRWSADTGPVSLAPDSAEMIVWQDDFQGSRPDVRGVEAMAAVAMAAAEREIAFGEVLAAEL